MSTTTIGLVVAMLATGTANTVFTKLQDKACVNSCDRWSPARSHYEQALIQVVVMFIGEAACLFLALFLEWYYRRQVKNHVPTAANPTYTPSKILDGLLAISQTGELEPLSGNRKFHLWIPTLCDLCATSMMMVALTMVPGYLFQILRGSVVVFTGIASTIFLKHYHAPYKWFAICLVVLGVGGVGFASHYYEESDPDMEPFKDESTGAGSFLVGLIVMLMAQIFPALQFVYEEKILRKYSISPIRAVALEGIFGLTSIFTIMFIGGTLNDIGVLPESVGFLFNISVGLQETLKIPFLLWTSIVITFCISTFNFTGLAIVRILSSTARSTIDTCRTLLVTIVMCFMLPKSNSLIDSMRDTFIWQTMFGFAVMLIGIFLFNDIIGYTWLPKFLYPREVVDDEAYLQQDMVVQTAGEELPEEKKHQ